MAMAERQHTEHAPQRRSKDGIVQVRPTGEAVGRGRQRRGELNDKTSDLAEAEELMRQNEELIRATISVTGGEKIVSWAANYLLDVSTLLGGRRVLGSMVISELDAHEMLRRGLPRAALIKLVDNLHVIQVDEASEALGMSVRTLQRHKNTPVVRLDVQQSGRTWKFAEILAKATHVLGSQDEAEQWLRRPAIGLDQQRPIDLLTTPAGVQLVEDYLGRLEYDGYT
jgi:putative toxin-antitoxin system antitoxin component (TIGR02293 family)